MTHGAIEPLAAGEASYREWRDTLAADPEQQAIYREEGAKMALWLQLAEARRASGLTRAEVAARLGVSRAQVARIEKRGYDAHTLTTLGDEFSLEVTVRRAARDEARTPTPARA